MGSDEIVIAGGPGPGGMVARRLLERALVDSGLARLHPRHVPPAAALAGEARSPRLVVALGAKAAAELLRRPSSLALERGRVRLGPDGGRVLITEHPSAIFSLADPVARGREYRRLVTDLMQVVAARPGPPTRSPDVPTRRVEVRAAAAAG